MKEMDAAQPSRGDGLLLVLGEVLGEVALIGTRVVALGAFERSTNDYHHEYVNKSKKDKRCIHLRHHYS